MAALPLPIINVQRCTGCHACVDCCPTNALAMAGDKATLQAPDRCTYCRACEEVCPVNAIALPLMIVIKAQSFPTSELALPIPPPQPTQILLPMEVDKPG